MTLPLTEMPSLHADIDAVPADRAVDLLLGGQDQAIAAVRAASDDLTRAASLMTQAVRSGGTLIYAAAGSSGLMALADCSELTGTFGIPTTQLQIHMAGGVPVTGEMPGDTEDATAEAQALTCSANDVAIVLSASGTTPYALAMAERAQAQGAKVVAIANNPDTPLLQMAEVAICLQTPAEVIAGSTRLAAGTAQKAALNVMSSVMGVQLGHVYGGMMVNLIADNIKLRARAATIVQTLTGVSDAQAQSALKAADGRVKLAILIAAGQEPQTAQDLLVQHAGHLGPCLHHTKTNQTQMGE
ncbi:MAG: N-acetylmuramic acid 6-phosphate etherase [Thalassovita sp.]